MRRPASLRALQDVPNASELVEGAALLACGHFALLRAGLVREHFGDVALAGGFSLCRRGGLGFPLCFAQGLLGLRDLGLQASPRMLEGSPEFRADTGLVEPTLERALTSLVLLGGGSLGGTRGHGTRSRLILFVAAEINQRVERGFDGHPVPDEAGGSSRLRRMSEMASVWSWDTRASLTSRISPISLVVSPSS